MSIPVVLVHGAWHAGWSWAALQHELDQRGVASYAPDLPGRGLSTQPAGGLAGDAAAIESMLERLASPVLLVGHSYGGAVVTQVAGRSEHVAGVVYVCAFALEPGESVNGFLRAAPRRRVGLSDYMVPQSDGSIVLDRRRAGAVYGDLPAPEVAAHLARLSPQPADTFTAVVTAAGFGRVPTTYVLCEHDDAVHPDHQELMAARCDRCVRLASGHFPMLSATAALGEIVATAATAAELSRPASRPT
jgi:pimeloyl-ACP methyl ester carboxylesterase